jgi:hypothetical protein
MADAFSGMSAAAIARVDRVVSQGNHGRWNWHGFRKVPGPNCKGDRYG